MAAASASSLQPIPVIIADYDPDTPFQCYICLDLLYKPVVLACGHVSCFWCVRNTMDGTQESHCSMCRQAYNHFPGICLVLHKLLLKLEPVAYKRRATEVLEEEKRRNIFSLQFLDPEIKEENLDSLDDSQKKTSALIDVDDALCSFCKELLYQPVVLNCGHVFCESCISGINAARINCHVCQSFHPGKSPNVFLDLDCYLKVKFPKEYALRQEQVLQKHAYLHQAVQSSGSHSKAEENGQSRTVTLSDFGLPTEPPNVHSGVGCDYCGMYPLAGKRYNCKDCEDSIGFDLCEPCFLSGRYRPGRFNQKHTRGHRFTVIRTRALDMIDRIIELGNTLAEELREHFPDEDFMDIILHEVIGE